MRLLYCRNVVDDDCAKIARFYHTADPSGELVNVPRLPAIKTPRESVNLGAAVRAAVDHIAPLKLRFTHYKIHIQNVAAHARHFKSVDSAARGKHIGELHC